MGYSRPGTGWLRPVATRVAESKITLLLGWVEDSVVRSDRQEFGVGALPRLSPDKPIIKGAGSKQILIPRSNVYNDTNLGDLFNITIMTSMSCRVYGPKGENREF